ncbi:hypothetical protein [Methylocystis sp. SB2]|uniref:hypothetical protein n=1 Tax=Methylocystis sp. (strain SB2) TaxID=743836 RepID=UPI0012EDACB3|nr:hypothetical protein [Methylocystis sp. SB2]ULO25089.1 hypothetical protein LNB28_06790 [Methylocystis sp. SB2]
MYDAPTKGDLDRNLSRIMHAAHHKAQAERARLTSEAAARGLASSGVLISSVVECVDKIHAESIEEAMRIIRDFASRMNVPPKEITPWARPHLENLANTVLGEIPSAGFPQIQQQMRSQYTLVFQHRLDGALRDIEIGFIGGRAVMTESQKNQDKAWRMLNSLYDRNRTSSEPIFVSELCSITGLTDEESQAAWRYLKDKGLIQTFSIPGTARINASGIDAIEGAQRHPDEPIPGFPSVSYNIVNNTTNIGTAINSPVQQAGERAVQSQQTAYTAENRADLVRFVDEFTTHLHELNLDARDKQKANAQLATLRAQLTDEPDQIIVQQAGRTLRNLTEGAIGSLIATAVQPTVWSWVAEVMARLFS